jgi:hypothetical protein
MTTQSYQNLSPLTEDINYPQDEVRHTNSESSIQGSSFATEYLIKFKLISVEAQT